MNKFLDSHNQLVFSKNMPITTLRLDCQLEWDSPSFFNVQSMIQLTYCRNQFTTQHRHLLSERQNLYRQDSWCHPWGKTSTCFDFEWSGTSYLCFTFTLNIQASIAFRNLIYIHEQKRENCGKCLLTVFH